MTIAVADVRQVALQIVSICRRLGARWAALALDMNTDADKRADAALRAARLAGVASVLEEISDETIGMALRLGEAEAKLAAIARLVTERERTTIAHLSVHFDDVVKYSKMMTDLKAILDAD